KGAILGAIEDLNTHGSTNGGAGLEEAKDMIRRNRVEKGVNRVILATDGDFNVGTTGRSDLVDLIQDEAKDGAFLSVLGLGTGNLKDATLEQIADKGNGVYAYIDSFGEAHRVPVEQIGGTLVTVAKDVKIQV